MPRRERREVEPQSCCRARGEVLHEDVGGRDQLRQSLPRLGVLEVERDALFAAIQPDEVRGEPMHRLVVAASEIACPGPFDLDHPRAVIGEVPRAERGRDGLLERHHGEAFERQHEFNPRAALCRSADFGGSRGERSPPW